MLSENCHCEPSAVGGGEAISAEYDNYRYIIDLMYLRLPRRPDSSKGNRDSSQWQ
jgi:hypothetical protein